MKLIVSELSLFRPHRSWLTYNFIRIYCLSLQARVSLVRWRTWGNLQYRFDTQSAALKSCRRSWRT